MNGKHVALQTVAEMIEAAKNLLKSAKVVADENGIYFSYENIYEELSDNYSVDWNSSNC